MLVVGEGEEVGVELGSMVEEAVEGKVGVGEAEALMYYITNSFSGTVSG